jgi:hypothetical protein
VDVSFNRMLGWAMLAGSIWSLAEGGESLSTARLADLRITADSRLPEDSWEPCPFLRYEEGLFPGLTRSSSAVLSIDRSDDAGLLPGPWREPFDWREAAPRERSAFRRFLEPIDRVVGLGNLHGSWETGSSQVSVSSDLSSWVDSLGAPLAGRVSLGLHVDMLGFEEADGGRLPLIESRRSGPRATFLSTGVGLTLGF